MTAHPITIGSSTSVASLWLMPRLSSFQLRNPNLDIKLTASDDERELFASEPEIIVGYGDGNWTGYEATMLFGDEIIPVCAPIFARDHADLGVEALIELPLIQLDRVSPRWTDWDEWLAAQSLPRGHLRGPIVSNYAVALQAAEFGLGIALGWHKLVRPLIDERRLVQLFDASIRSPIDFFIARRNGRLRSSTGSGLHSWLTVQ